MSDIVHIPRNGGQEAIKDDLPLCFLETNKIMLVFSNDIKRGIVFLHV